MNINWKVRFKNKTWLATFVACIVGFVYQVLAMFEIAPTVSQDSVLQLATIVINILAVLGITMDPTTAGVSDSARALAYEEPHKDGEDNAGR